MLHNSVVLELSDTGELAAVDVLSSELEPELSFGDEPSWESGSGGEAHASFVFRTENVT
ncbi:hypothetical protein ACFV8Z_14400 [Streptomyces sp. NPDC059837]|uniref:hypothetical protein n=1 Tax=Streptomyces sp. NPDC059837 TaxID=3346968 RepID=UPI00364B725D